MIDPGDGKKTGVSPFSGYAPPVDTRFKKGNKGGPGRPPGRTITARLRKIIEEDDDGKVADALAKAATSAALRGDFRFWNKIAEMLEGTSVNTGQVNIVITHVGGSPPAQVEVDDD